MKRASAVSAPRWLLVVALVLGASSALLAACGGSANGWVSVGTGDTYGEWELFVEVDDGEWTGCLRLEPGPKECVSPDVGFERFEDSDGAAFGVAPESGTLEFEDGNEVELIETNGIDRNFYVVADDAEVHVRG
jgi:hypothetical protein